MRRSLLVCMFLMGQGALAQADEPKTVTIPLDQIWAWDMPGTRDVRKLENDPIADSLANEISISLRFLPATEGTEPRLAFAVLGKGIEALRQAHAVLVDNKKPRQSFPAGRELTLVFFSHKAGSYVHLQQIGRHGNVIEVHYRFVPHRTQELTSHFALIPVGKLSVGKFSADIIQSPMEQKYLDWGLKPFDPDLGRRVVCKSFSFAVVERELVTKE